MSPCSAARRTGAATATTLAIGLAVAVLASGCTSDDGSAPGPDRDEETAATSRSTTSSLGRITGELSTASKRTLRHRITEVVDRWFDDAYLGGSYPRKDFGRSFEVFTPGAAALAQDNRSVMSNAGLGEKVDGVEAVNRTLKIDALAVRGKAVGVTARFTLGLVFSADAALDSSLDGRHDRVEGRLYLSYTDGAWRVFGYDVDREKV